MIADDYDTSIFGNYPRFPLKLFISLQMFTDLTVQFFQYHDTVVFRYEIVILWRELQEEVTK